MLDSGIERQVVKNRGGSVSHGRVVREVRDFQLLGSHESVRNFLRNLGVHVVVRQIELLDALEVRQDFADRGGFFLRDVAFLDLDHLNLGQQFQGRVEVVFRQVVLQKATKFKLSQLAFVS